MSLLPSNRHDPQADETTSEKLAAIDDARYCLLKAVTRLDDAASDLDNVGLLVGGIEANFAAAQSSLTAVRRLLNFAEEDLEGER